MKKIAVWLVVFFIGVLVASVLIIRPYYFFMTRVLSISPFKTLVSGTPVSSYDNQINFLFLGVSGEGRDGPNLSDSIIVASYDMKVSRLTTISIPRDIWSDTLRDKINSAYAYGEAKKPDGGGFVLAKSEVSSIVGFPIHYAAAMDYDRFKELIDFLGGINVEIETSFVDNKFPIFGRENDECNGDPEFKCRYETVSFRRGETEMSGETALKFVRSRNAIGSEGTDFAREARQRKVMTALGTKMITFLKTPSPVKYHDLYNLLNNIVKRDISNQQLAQIMKGLVLKGNFTMKGIGLGEEMFIIPEISDRYEYKWVLVPESGNYDDIHKFIKCNIKGMKNCGTTGA